MDGPHEKQVETSINAKLLWAIVRTIDRQNHNKLKDASWTLGSRSPGPLGRYWYGTFVLLSL